MRNSNGLENCIEENKMKKEMVSVVIPVYNAERYLGKCLESVINQTYKELEIIIVNDGSVDRSLDIIKEYEQKDNRIVVISGENNGVSCARNKGLDCAEGTKIVFFDSDDIMERNAIEKMLYQINLGYDAVIGGYSIIDENNEQIGSEILCKNDKDCLMCESNNLVEVMDINPFPGNKMFLTNIIKENNIRWPIVSLGEDQGFYLAYLCMCEKVALLSGTVFQYRIIKSSASHRVDKHILDINKGFDYVYSFAKNNNVNKEFLDNLCNRRIENYKIQFLRYIEFKKRKDRKEIFYTLSRMIEEVAVDGGDALSEKSKLLVKDARKKYKYRVIYLSSLYIYIKNKKRKRYNK